MIIANRKEIPLASKKVSVNIFDKKWRLFATWRMKLAMSLSSSLQTGLSIYSLIVDLTFTVDQ